MLHIRIDEKLKVDKKESPRTLKNQIEDALPALEEAIIKRLGDDSSLRNFDLGLTVEENTDRSGNSTFTISSKNLIELTKLLNEEDDDIELHIFNNKVIFKFNSIIMMSRLINGTYPDTSKLIPNEFEFSMKVNLQEFYNSIDRASLLTNEADKNTIKLESENNNITLSSNIPEIGYVEENMKVEKSNEKEIKIAFSSKYMKEALKTFETEDIEIFFNSEIKPIIIKNIENEDLIQLILPIRTY